VESAVTNLECFLVSDIINTGNFIMIILAIARRRTSSNTSEDILVALLAPFTKDQLKGNGTEEDGDAAEGLGKNAQGERGQDPEGRRGAKMLWR